MLTTGSPRKALKNFGDFVCDNQVTAFLFNVEFEKSLEKCIRNVEEKMQDQKIPGLTEELYKNDLAQAYILPIHLRRAMMSEKNLKKLRIFLTNMPGPQQPMYIEGKKVHWRIASTAGFTNTFAL